MNILNVSDKKVRAEATKMTLTRSGINFHETLEYLINLFQKIYTDKKVTIVVSLIGGAASGKTTFADELAKFASNNSLVAASFSTDDFLIGDREFRRKNFEGKSPLAKYDFEFMNQKTSAIVTNKDPRKIIKVPKYDGHSGMAIAAGEENFPNKIGPVDLLIVEGDFDAVQNPDFKIYLHLDDNDRFKLRLNRDMKSRNVSDHSEVLQNFNQRQVTQQQEYTIKAVESVDLILEVLLDKDNNFSFNVYERI